MCGLACGVDGGLRTRIQLVLARVLLSTLSPHLCVIASVMRMKPLLLLVSLSPAAAVSASASAAVSASASAASTSPAACNNSNYFWGAPVLSCPGRTFPVSVSYLEDVYAATNYLLAPDSRAAFRAGSAAAASAAVQRKASARGNAGKAALMAAGWGDDEGLGGSVLNPNYDPEVYAGYSDRARRNLARLNEDVLDLDLIEEVGRAVAGGGEGSLGEGGGCRLCWTLTWSRR